MGVIPSVCNRWKKMVMSDWFWKAYKAAEIIQPLKTSYIVVQKMCNLRVLQLNLDLIHSNYGILDGHKYLKSLAPIGWIITPHK